MTRWIAAVFFLSGAAALIYQVAWQRALFVIYGLDAVSVAVVVSAFMLGLGLGSLGGGALSRRWPKALIPLFAAAELGIGLFGFVSLDLFAAVAELTRGVGHFATGVVAFLLVVVPCGLMGATLPLLVTISTQRSGEVGRSVSTLYFANTIGAAIGSYLAAALLLRVLGLIGVVQATATLNLLLGVLVLGLAVVELRNKT